MRGECLSIVPGSPSQQHSPIYFLLLDAMGFNFFYFLVKSYALTMWSFAPYATVTPLALYLPCPINYWMLFPPIMRSLSYWWEYLCWFWWSSV